MVSAEFLEDRVVFKACIRSAKGFQDRDYSRAVPYSQIKDLPTLTKQGPIPGDAEVTAIFIPQTGHTIVFYLSTHLESYVGGTEEDLHGPYLDDRVKDKD